MFLGIILILLVSVSVQFGLMGARFQKNSCTNCNYTKKHSILFKKQIYKRINQLCFINNGLVNFYASPKPQEYNLSRSVYLNEVFTGLLNLVGVNNKTSILNHKFSSVCFMQGVNVMQKTVFKNSRAILFLFTLKNYTNKVKRVTLSNKLFINSQEPCLNVTKYSNCVNYNYKSNSILVTFYNNTDKLPCVAYTNYAQTNALTYSTINLKPNSAQSVKMLVYFNLYPQTNTTYAPPSIIKKTVPISVKSGANVFAFLVTTKSKPLNYLINTFLPQEIKRQFIKSKQTNIYNYIFLQDISNLKQYSYKYIVSWLLCKKEYAKLYKYLLDYVLGFKIIGNVISFYKNSHLQGKIVINYREDVITKFNLGNCYYFVFRGIIYKNVNVLNLNYGVVSFKNI